MQRMQGEKNALIMLYSLIHFCFYSYFYVEILFCFSGSLCHPIFFDDLTVKCISSSKVIFLATLCHGTSDEKESFVGENEFMYSVRL